MAKHIENPSSEKEITSVIQCLIDNGITNDEADTVAEALYFIMKDEDIHEQLTTITNKKKNNLMLDDDQIEQLKQSLFEYGIYSDEMADFLDTELTTDDKDVIDNLLDEIIDQMPEEELRAYYIKYCTTKKSASTFYKMCLLFKLSLGLKAVNDITAACGFSEKLIAENIATIKMRQTVPFIPTDEIIAEYAQTIKDNYVSDKFTCESCTFDGYEYLYPIKNE